MIEDRSCCEKERDTVEREEYVRWEDGARMSGMAEGREEGKKSERGREGNRALGRKQYNSIY